jgi:hypothetical protein
MLARFLSVPEAHAVGIAVMLDAWALEMTDAEGRVDDEAPEEVLAAACGWDGEPAALLTGLLRAKIVDAPEHGGIAVVSRRRYESALTGQVGRSEKARKAAIERWHGKNDAPSIAPAVHPDACSDAKTQTQTQTQTEASASQEPAVAVPAAMSDKGAPGKNSGPPADFELVAQTPGKPPRRLSAGEELFGRLERRRQVLCESEGLPFVPSRWPAARINREFGPVAKLEKANGEDWQRFRGAWNAFIEDPEAAKLDVPYAMDWFWKCRSRYEGRGLKAGGTP